MHVQFDCRVIDLHESSFHSLGFLHALSPRFPILTSGGVVSYGKPLALSAPDFETLVVNRVCFGLPTLRFSYSKGCFA